MVQALETKLFSFLAVSSDSEEILSLAKKVQALTIRRPAEMATDTAGKIPAIRHCFQEAERMTKQQFDILVDLDATSPLRDPQDIINCVNLLKEKKASNIITGTPSRRSPYFNMVELDEKGRPSICKKPGQNVVRRQDAPSTFDLNASIYVWTRDSILNEDSVFQKKTYFYEMPEERSLDIDKEIDFQIVEFLMKKKGMK